MATPTRRTDGDSGFGIIGRTNRILASCRSFFLSWFVLNATFWTITDNHLPAQLAEHGYEVYVFDLRGSGENAKVGRCDRVNKVLRQTFLCERAESGWTVDDLVKYDVPAILDYVERDAGRNRVNWIGHSLGGMLVFPYLELAPHPERIANFVGMGSTIVQAETPQTDMLRANQGLRLLSLVASPGRLGRPLAFVRIPGMEMIDRFYYSNENVDQVTVARFYGYTLEDTGPGGSPELHAISATATWLLIVKSITQPCWVRSRHRHSWSPATATSCPTSHPRS